MKKTFLFNQLVRDKVPRSMRNAGCVLRTKRLSKSQLLEALAMKAEEKSEKLTQGILATKEELIETFVDLKEILEIWAERIDTKKMPDAVTDNMLHQKIMNEQLQIHQVELKNLIERQLLKRKTMGSFEKGYYIEQVKVSTKNDKWCSYLAENHEEAA